MKITKRLVEQKLTEAPAIKLDDEDFGDEFSFEEFGLEDPSQLKDDEAIVTTKTDGITGGIASEDRVDAPYTEAEQILNASQIIKLRGLDKTHNNRLVRELDKCLMDAKLLQAQNQLLDIPEQDAFCRCNLLIEGLPGSGKTAIIKAWAKARQVNLFALNAKDMKLELSLNGTPMKDDRAKNPTLVMARVDALKDLERKNSVLFLDEYNRQKDPQIRGSLLTLIGDHCVYGKPESGLANESLAEAAVVPVDDFDDDWGEEGNEVNYIFYKNLLFTIAAINPAGGAAGTFDPGVDKLNAAELSRFKDTFVFDSTPEQAKSYIEWFYDKKKAAITKDLNKAKSSPIYKFTYLNYVLRKALGLLITEAPGFKFNTRDDLKDLGVEDKTMFNQRILCDTLEALYYRDAETNKKNMIEQFRDWLGQSVDSEQVNLAAKKYAKDHGITLDAPTKQKIIQMLGQGNPIFGVSNLLDSDKKMLNNILNTIAPTFEKIEQEALADIPGYEHVEEPAETSKQDEPEVVGKGRVGRDNAKETDSSAFAPKRAAAKGGSLQTGSIAARIAQLRQGTK